jgi:acyl-CoA thioesterase-1
LQWRFFRAGDAAMIDPGYRTLRRFVLVAGVMIAGLGGLADAAARPVKVVVIGDNNIKGKGVAAGEAYPAQLERALRARGVDARVINAGRNGDTATSVLGRLNTLAPAGTDVAVVSVGVNDVVYDGVDPDASRANVREIGRRLRARGIEVVLLPTGGRFQGALAAKPELHIEPGFGPRPGTTEWHLKPEGYAILAERDLPQVMDAIARAQARQ